jgi:hypothetical protein
MKLAVRPTQIRDTVNAFVYSLPGGGKTGFALSAYEEHGTERRGPVFLDTDKGGVDDTSLDMGLSGKIPVIPVGDDEAEKIFYAVAYPKEIIDLVNSHPRFKSYEVTAFVFDTISSGIEVMLGSSAMSFNLDAQKLIPASGIMKTARKRPKGGSPAQSDYKANHNRARLWFRKARDLPFHTIITCHATYADMPGQEGKADDEKKDQAGYPSLPGQLRYDAAKLVDHFFYMEQTTGGQFVTHTRPYGVWNSRTRIRKFIKEPEVDFTFPKLLKIYQDARAAGAVEEE